MCSLRVDIVQSIEAPLKDELIEEMRNEVKKSNIKEEFSIMALLVSLYESNERF